MHHHTYRQEPLHNVIGRPHEKFPDVEQMCGHIDVEADEVCLLNAEEHDWKRRSSLGYKTSIASAHKAGK